jgi:hypothetical protein
MAGVAAGGTVVAGAVALCAWALSLQPIRLEAPAMPSSRARLDAVTGWNFIGVILDENTMSGRHATSLHN